MSRRCSKSAVKKVPKSWLKYTKIGDTIEATRFIAFKSPMRRQSLTSSRIDQSKWFTVADLLSKVEACGYRIGMIINLCNSDNYDMDEVDGGIEYVRIQSNIAHIEESADEFLRVVRDFLQQNSDEKTLIGVHCMHGLNRTGYLICAFMVQELSVTAEEALERFESARGHRVESTRAAILTLRRDNSNNLCEKL